MTRLWLLPLSLLFLASIAHSHSNEPPHFKYTKEANQEAAEEAAHGHHHSHGGGGCPHSHSHDTHDHGHAHDDHDHGHAHDDHDHGHHHSHSDHDEGHGHTHSHSPPSNAKKAALEEHQKFTGALSFLNDAKTRLWVYSIGATLLISFAPFIILFAIPIKAEGAEGSPLLKVLLAFGSGGLLGDAFLHLIPHATPSGGHGHSHSHSHSDAGHSHEPHDMTVGFWILTGIISFLTVEKFVRIVRGEEGHGHSHGHAKKAKTSDDEGSGDDKKSGKNKEKKKGEGKKEAEKPSHRDVKVAAYLNLVADFAHNFTDGLAIGASFLAGSTVGFVTMVTVLVHEVPHEIGDFAILIQSGFSRRKAMMMQLVTAAGALSGCVLSLLTADGSLADAAASSWVLPFTAGGFIYIATVSVIPELLENSSFGQSLKEIIAILLGIFLMYLIAVFE